MTVEPRLPSWWLEQALAAEGNPPPAPALSGDATADVAIVGGGYTGLWTALAVGLWIAVTVAMTFALAAFWRSVNEGVKHFV